MINASAVEAALVGILAADPELAALMPDGVYFDLAPQGSTAFVVLSLADARSLPEFHDVDTFREFQYLIKAVARSSAGADVAAADLRIQTLLDRQALDLGAEAGGTLMLCQWINRVRYTEPDPAEASAAWKHRGGRYAVTVTPT